VRESLRAKMCGGSKPIYSIELWRARLLKQTNASCGARYGRVSAHGGELVTDARDSVVGVLVIAARLVDLLTRPSNPHNTQGLSGHGHRPGASNPLWGNPPRRARSRPSITPYLGPRTNGARQPLARPDVWRLTPLRARSGRIQAEADAAPTPRTGRQKDSRVHLSDFPPTSARATEALAAPVEAPAFRDEMGIPSGRGSVWRARRASGTDECADCGARAGPVYARDASTESTLACRQKS
jgi:hypothetical protein